MECFGVRFRNDLMLVLHTFDPTRRIDITDLALERFSTHWAQNNAHGIALSNAALRSSTLNIDVRSVCI